MANKRRWNDLSERSRRLILAGAVIEGVLKLLALIDMARRPAERIRGSKARWAAAVVVVNSGGGVPIAYFLWGRRKDQ